MASDPNDSGAAGDMAGDESEYIGSSGYRMTRAGNPTVRTGRADGTQPIQDMDPASVPHTSTYRQPVSNNPTDRSGRPDADMAAPQRSYEQLKGAAARQVTDVSANKLRMSRPSPSTIEEI